MNLNDPFWTLFFEFLAILIKVEFCKIFRQWFNGSMSADENIRFNGNGKEGYSRILSETSRVDLNNLIKRVREEEKKSKRNSLAISAAALSAVAVFGIILTL